MSTNRYNGMKIASSSARIVTGSSKNKLEDLIASMLQKNQVSEASTQSATVKTAQVQGKKKNADGTLSSGQIEVETKLTDQSGNFKDTKQCTDKTAPSGDTKTDADEKEYNRGDEPVNVPEKVTAKMSNEDLKKKLASIPICDLPVLVGLKEADDKTSESTKRLMKEANLNKESYDFLHNYFMDLYPKEYVDIMLVSK